MFHRLCGGSRILSSVPDPSSPLEASMERYGWGLYPGVPSRATFDELPSSSRPRYGGCEVRMCALLFPATLPRFPNVLRFLFALFLPLPFSSSVSSSTRLRLRLACRVVRFHDVRGFVYASFPFCFDCRTARARYRGFKRTSSQPSLRVHRLKMKTGHGCRWCTRFCRTHEAQVLELCR